MVQCSWLYCMLPREHKTVPHMAWFPTVKEYYFKKLISPKIYSFLEFNFTPEMPQTTVWKALKAYLRGQKISYTVYEKKKKKLAWVICRSLSEICRSSNTGNTGKTIVKNWIRQSLHSTNWTLSFKIKTKISWTYIVKYSQILRGTGDSENHTRGKLIHKWKNRKWHRQSNQCRVTRQGELIGLLLNYRKVCFWTTEIAKNNDPG